jgi:hypothetical protein
LPSGSDAAGAVWDSPSRLCPFAPGRIALDGPFQRSLSGTNFALPNGHNFGEDDNLYRFVGNDPTNATDPSGTKVDPTATFGARDNDPKRTRSATVTTPQGNEGKVIASPNYDILQRYPDGLSPIDYEDAVHIT